MFCSNSQPVLAAIAFFLKEADFTCLQLLRSSHLCTNINFFFWKSWISKESSQNSLHPEAVRHMWKGKLRWQYASFKPWRKKKNIPSKGSPVSVPPLIVGLSPYKSSKPCAGRQLPAELQAERKLLGKVWQLWHFLLCLPQGRCSVAHV